MPFALSDLLLAVAVGATLGSGLTLVALWRLEP